MKFSEPKTKRMGAPAPMRSSSAPQLLKAYQLWRQIFGWLGIESHNTEGGQIVDG